jgi:hypothetical protein
MKTCHNETCEFAGLSQRVRTVDISFTGHKVEGTKHPCKKVKNIQGQYVQYVSAPLFVVLWGEPPHRSLQLLGRG